MKLKNPFENEENLQDWLQKDEFYLQSKRTDYLNFRKSIKTPGIFMSLQETYLNIVNNITKHSITATLIMLFALGSVGASAAELFAPEDYKPSTVAQKTFNPKNFETNKQKEKNPYTALKPDENNNVASLDQCYLAVKYPKDIQNIKISIQRNSDVNIIMQGTFNTFTVFTDIPIGSDTKYATGSTNWIRIECTQNKKTLPLEGLQNGIGISKEELRQKTGWFIAQADLKEIEYIETLNGTMLVQFFYNGMYYQIDSALETEENKANNWILFGNQIQIQFNSLVENEANSQIVDKPEANDQTNSEQSFTNQEFEVTSGGQMRIGNDASGGYYLRKVSDGKGYIVMGSTLQKAGISSLENGKISFSGKFKSVNEFKDIVIPTDNVDFIITEI
jgi:hypothetical protein